MDVMRITKHAGAFAPAFDLSRTAALPHLGWKSKPILDEETFKC
jgi:hypothetical protein